jgi:hypothetical protein
MPVWAMNSGWSSLRPNVRNKRMAVKSNPFKPFKPSAPGGAGRKLGIFCPLLVQI